MARLCGGPPRNTGDDAVLVPGINPRKNLACMPAGVVVCIGEIDIALGNAVSWELATDILETFAWFLGVQDPDPADRALGKAMRAVLRMPRRDS